MINILSSRGVFLDGEFAGTVTAFLLRHPELVAELQAALDAHEETFRQAIVAAQSASSLQPPVSSPLPKYYRVIKLPAPIGAATHAGIVQPPAVESGAWLFDLLAAVPGTVDDFTLVQSGLKAPAGEKISSLSELTCENATADITAALAQEKITPDDGEGA